MRNNKSDIDKNIKILLSISDAEKPLFTLRQQELINLLMAGTIPADLPQKMGCSKANSYAILKSCAAKIEKIRNGQYIKSPRIKSPKPRKARRSNSRIDYSKYKDCDMSLLSEREVEILELKINNPHMTLREMAVFIGTSPGTCGAQLSNAIKKMDGDYVSKKEYQKEYRKRMSEETKEKYRETKRIYRQEHREYHKEYQRKWREENKEKVQKDEKERNKKYYQQHREEIIKKNRERWMKKKMDK